MCDRDPVICHGYFGVLGAFLAVSHLAFIQRAAAAVYDEPVFLQIQGKFCPGGEFEVYFFCCVFPNKVRQFYGADILALPVVGTAL